MFFGDFCFCVFARPRKKYFLSREEFFFWSHNTTRAYYYYDPGFQPERRPSDGESDHVDVRFLRLLCLLLLLLLLLLARRRLTSCFFFLVSRHGTHASIFGRYSFSLSLSLSDMRRRRRRLLLHRDVQETCVKLGFLYPNAKTSDPVQRRADCVTMFRVVGCTCASTLFWCLSPPRPFLSPFFFSLSSARAVHATTCVRTMVCVCLCGVY